jgi:hypothetical protein
LVVQRLRQYPIGRALSIAAGKGFTVVVTARREQSTTEDQKNKKKNKKKNRKDENHENHENQHKHPAPNSLLKTVTTLPLTLANIEQQEQEHQQTAQAHSFEDGDERELREVDVEELAVYSEESENSSVDSDLENERKEQLRLERQHEAEEDALIEQMGMRVLDERGDIVLHPDHAPTPSSQPQVRVARDLFDVWLCGCVKILLRLPLFRELVEMVAMFCLGTLDTFYERFFFCCFTIIATAFSSRKKRRKIES